MTVQARAFAAPILAAIADHPPDFEDDFGAGGPGWTWDPRMADQVSIVDGVMQVNGMGGHGIFPPHDMLWSQNLVFEFDVRLNSPGDMGTFFRQRSSEVWYGFFLSSEDGSWWVDLPSDNNYLAQGAKYVLPIAETNRVIIIAWGNQFAVYLNGQPLVYVEDVTFPDAGNLMLSFHGAESGESVQGEFDNFRFWNLDNVPNLPNLP
jgi:hypothetical protein